mmetsp:Transcript_9231/g.10185  ORF Transcript_9231/g.10185 Transcript_9231/m.10185 type:complete len:433 (-) Transcript_9231:21-1319(-)
MNVLVIGSGGREHALAFKASQSTKVQKVYVAPGNAGTELEPKLENVPDIASDFDALVNFVKENTVSLTIVGPEAPLVQGIVDRFQKEGLAIFGPTSGAAQLEGSKSFTKDFLARHNIPTASYQTFTEIEPALEYVKTKGAPIVIKADGLAAGKGVIVATTVQEAEDAIKDMLVDNAFGDAGSRVVVEDFLVGEEASFIVMVDGTTAVPFATSQDHKRAYDNDKGPNTGGMGAYSPAPVVTAEVHRRVMDEIINPTVKGMSDEGNSYTGFLYAGLMINAEGAPYVIEYNCRFGDPETQPIMLRLQSDLVELIECANKKELHTINEIQFDTRAAVGVVLASGGYPKAYTKGNIISGLRSTYEEGTKVFHAGTAKNDDGIVTSGGRVLCATALGNTVTEAHENAYKLVDEIAWTGMEYRNDIAYLAIDREEKEME